MTWLDVIAVAVPLAGLVAAVVMIHRAGPWTCGNCGRGQFFAPVPKSGCPWAHCGWRPGIDPPNEARRGR